EAGTGILFITHDLAVAAERADELVVVRDGIVEEQGPARRLLGTPESDYTRKLLADAPSMQTLKGAVGAVGPSAGTSSAVAAVSSRSSSSAAASSRSSSPAAPSRSSSSSAALSRSPRSSASEYKSDHPASAGAGAHSLEQGAAHSQGPPESSAQHADRAAAEWSGSRTLDSAGEDSPAASASSPAAPLVEVRGLTQVFARMPRDEADAEGAATTGALAGTSTHATAARPDADDTVRPEAGSSPPGDSAFGDTPPDGSAPGATAEDTAIIGIEDVSFTVPEGTTLGLVGESGSGKSTIGRA